MLLETLGTLGTRSARAWDVFSWHTFQREPRPPWRLSQGAEPSPLEVPTGRCPQELCPQGV